MKRVTGIGGIFFQSATPAQLYDWYEKHLGIKREPHGQGATFEWRELQAPDGSEPGAKGATAWSIFSQAMLSSKTNEKSRRTGWKREISRASGVRRGSS